jgi:hypothetical protein
MVDSAKQMANKVTVSEVRRVGLGELIVSGMGLSDALAVMKYAPQDIPEMCKSPELQEFFFRHRKQGQALLLDAISTAARGGNMSAARLLLDRDVDADDVETAPERLRRSQEAARVAIATAAASARAACRAQKPLILANIARYRESRADD